MRLLWVATEIINRKYVKPRYPVKWVPGLHFYAGVWVELGKLFSGHCCYMLLQ